MLHITLLEDRQHQPLDSPSWPHYNDRALSEYAVIEREVVGPVETRRGEQRGGVRPTGAGAPAVPGREKGGRPGVREEAKRRTRQLILEAAARRFVQEGFLEATTASIAQEAGVAHGTLFLHFPDRDALLLAVVEELLYQLGSDLHRACFRATDLGSLVRLFLDSLSKNETMYGSLVRDLPRFPLPLKRTVFATFAALTAHFTEIVERGQAQGVVRSIPPAMANAFFFGTLNHFFLYRDLMTPDGRVVPTLGEPFRDAFLKMISLSGDPPVAPEEINR